MFLSGVHSLDGPELSKSKIIYFERLAAHVFSLMFLVGIALFALQLFHWGLEFRSLWAKGPITLVGLQSLPTLSLLLSSLVVAGTLLIALGYSRAINRAESRLVRLARVAAGLIAMIGALIIYWWLRSIGLWDRFVTESTSFLGTALYHWSGVAQLAIVVGSTLLLQRYYIISYRTLQKLEPAQIFMLRESPDLSFTSRIFRTSMGVPRIVDFMRQGQTTTSIVFLIANCFHSLSTMFFMISGSILMVQWFDAYQTCRGALLEICLSQRGPYYVLLSVVVGLVAFLIAPLIGAVITAQARRVVRFSIDDLLKRDDRRPVLFLRPFKDDQVYLKPAKIILIARIGRWLASIRTLDELLLEEGTPYGPVVAIGNPRDELPPYGAARGYFDDKTWQQAVSELAEEALAIIICVDDFEGVWWEIENVAIRHLEKTLLLMHPGCAASANNENILDKLNSKLIPFSKAELLVEMLDALRSQNSDTPPVLGLFVNRHGDLDIAASTTFSQLAYLLEIRMFLRSKWGLAGN